LPAIRLPAGAIYLVKLYPTMASFANVTSTATLGGATVNAIFANGSSSISQQYTILTASSGLSAAFAPGVVNTNLPSNFETALSFDANPGVGSGKRSESRSKSEAK
jgi:hypothetical protein